jgi:hypothetical protein
MPCDELSTLAGDAGMAPCTSQPGCFVPRLDAGAGAVANDASAPADD